MLFVFVLWERELDKRADVEERSLKQNEFAFLILDILSVNISLQENHYQPVNEEECLDCNCYLTGSFGSKCDALTGKREQIRV